MHPMLTACHAMPCPVMTWKADNAQLRPRTKDPKRDCENIPQVAYCLLASLPVPYYCLFWHLRELEVVPHTRGPMLSSMNSSNIKRNGFERKPQKPRVD